MGKSFAVVACVNSGSIAMRQLKTPGEVYAMGIGLGGYSLNSLEFI
jgi:hypothetical protein